MSTTKRGSQSERYTTLLKSEPSCPEPVNAWRSLVRETPQNLQIHEEPWDFLCVSSFEGKFADIY